MKTVQGNCRWEGAHSGASILAKRDLSWKGSFCFQNKTRFSTDILRPNQTWLWHVAWHN